MDIYEPNTWTKELVLQNPAKCFAVIKDVTNKLLPRLSAKDYKNVTAGIDRILNGLSVMNNAGIGGCRPFMCFYSWIKADIVVFSEGIKGTMIKERREEAIKCYTQALSFCAGEQSRARLSMIIKMLKAGKSIAKINQEYSRSIPDDTVDLMKKLSGKLDEMI